METVSAENFHRRITELHKEIREAYRKLGMIQSVYDKRLAEMYHKLERMEADDVDSIAFTQELKAVLERRRVVKDEKARMRLFNGLAGHCLREIDLYYDKTLEASFQIRNDFNVRLTLDQVLTEVGVELG
ncbi:hypothetical protein FZC83_05400 [Rossellomorea marisflavi]|uniref:Uncharacterized protein n=2 Tax=Rossellomorea marisflavi TaxID=189381 RepID=A0A5D4S225_9BACI|nr:hypothetical protein FZC83_05400 [Rossellomorea marisflavi]